MRVVKQSVSIMVFGASLLLTSGRIAAQVQPLVGEVDPTAALDQISQSMGDFMVAHVARPTAQ